MTLHLLIMSKKILAAVNQVYGCDFFKLIFLLKKVKSFILPFLITVFIGNVELRSSRNFLGSMYQNFSNLDVQMRNKEEFFD